MHTKKELMEEMWCRGLGYCDVVHYAGKFRLTSPTEREYLDYCKEKNAKMDEFFRQSNDGNEDQIT